MISPVLLIALLVGAAALVFAQSLPIPPVNVGHISGDGNSPVLLEIFADFQCIDSTAAWPTLYKVLLHYGSKLRVVYYQYPLWGHHQASDVAVAVEIMAAANSPSRFWEIANFVYSNQPVFTNDAWYNKSRQELYVLLAQWAAKYGVSNATFYTQIQPFTEQWARVSMQLMVSRLRQIYGTPAFTVNGFQDYTLDSTTTYEQWRAYLDPLVNQKNVHSVEM
jgi:protein-disulfide isomerase